MARHPLPQRRDYSRRPPRSLRTWLVVTTAVAALGCAAVVAHSAIRGDGAQPLSGGSRSGGGSTAAPAADDAARSPTERRWLAVLHTIDTRRAEAWRLGDPALLGRVYLAGASELGEDRRMLRGYLRRGLTVKHVEMTFASVTVRASSPEGVSLVVVDRLGPAVARDAAGHRAVLPHDQPTRHAIELRRGDGQWRIARIALA